MSECRIQGLITCPDGTKYVIKIVFVRDIDMERIRDWITYFHNQDWLDSDLANDYLADLEQQHQTLHDTFYHEIDDNNNSNKDEADLGHLKPLAQPDLQSMIDALTLARNARLSGAKERSQQTPKLSQ